MSTAMTECVCTDSPVGCGAALIATEAFGMTREAHSTLAQPALMINDIHTHSQRERERGETDGMTIKNSEAEREMQRDGEIGGEIDGLS